MCGTSPTCMWRAAELRAVRTLCVVDRTSAIKGIRGRNFPRKTVQSRKARWRITPAGLKNIQEKRTGIPVHQASGF